MLSEKINQNEVLNNSRIGLWRVSYPEKFTVLSGAAALFDLLGMNENILTLENWVEFIKDYSYADDIVYLLDEYNFSLRSEAPFSGKFRVWNRLTHQWRWCFVTGNNYTDPRTGEVIVSGTFQDATNFITNNHMDYTAHERVRLMLDVMPLCCNFWDDKFQNVDCNKEAVVLFELSSKEEYLQRFWELSPEFQPDGTPSATGVLDRVRNAFKTGRSVFEWLHCKPSGELVPTEVTCVRVLFEERYYVVAYLRDLRQINAARRMLDNERLLLKEVVSSSPVCFAIVKNGVAIFTNPFITNFLGITEGEHIAQYFLSSTEAGQVLQAFEDNDYLNWRPVMLKAKSGLHKEMMLSMAKIAYEGEVAVMNWLLDFTEIYRIERQLLKARDDAKRSDRAKSMFIANMSHEIRTPMNAIIGINHLLLQTTLDNKQLNYIKKMQQASQSLLHIINDILDFSKIEAGKLEIEWISFSPYSVLEHVVDMGRSLAAKKQLSVTGHIDENIPEILTGDPVRLNQVLLNLVSNAVKFTEKGQVSIECKLLHMDNNDISMQFSVKDTGIGMDSNGTEMLFTPFMQVDASTTRQYGGTGLGLAISKKLVSLMGGNIWVESKPGAGSIFYFTASFRVPEEEEKIEPASVKTVIPADFRPSDYKILLAEDNNINQMLATELLKLRGFEVDIADNGRQAIEKTKNNSYDLILMDIQMPEMDGIEATKEIRKEKKFNKIPIIAMTAHAMESDKRKSLKAGMNDHITKPIEPELLYTTIFKWLNRSKN